MKNTRLSFIMNKNKKFKFFLLIVSILILIISLSIFKVNTLQIIDYQADKIIWEKKLTDGDNFSIKYLHSVAKTPVIEFFEIKNGEILLTGTEYQSYGAGLPTSAGQGNYITADGKFIIENINQRLPEIMLRVSDYAQHEFIFNNKTFKLYEKVETETLLQIKTTAFSYLSFILRRY